MPIKPYTLLSTLFSPLTSWKGLLLPCRRGIVRHASERVTESVSCKGEIGPLPEGGGETLTTYNVVVNSRVYFYGETTKSGYLTFDPGGMSTINWSKSDQ